VDIPACEFTTHQLAGKFGWIVKQPNAYRFESNNAVKSGKRNWPYASIKQM
jgi:hypothetical protein